MVLGIVTAIVVLFYYVSNEDRDIRKHSWAMVASTISIFLAVTRKPLAEDVFIKFTSEVTHSSWVLAP